MYILVEFIIELNSKDDYGKWFIDLVPRLVLYYMLQAVVWIDPRELK